MNKHSDFFLASQDAHYTSFFIYLAHLFDNPKDSISISRYLHVIKNNTDSIEFEEISNEFNLLANRVRSLLKVRHKRFAPIDVNLSEKELFLSLNTTWNEIRLLIYETASFIENWQMQVFVAKVALELLEMEGYLKLH